MSGRQYEADWLCTQVPPTACIGGKVSVQSGVVRCYTGTFDAWSKITTEKGSKTSTKGTLSNDLLGAGGALVPPIL